MKKSFLILGHVPNIYKNNNSDFLGLGDGIRLILIANSITKNDISVDLCVNIQIREFLSNELLIKYSKVRNILVWEDLGKIDLSEYNKIIYVDEPSLFEKIKTDFGLPISVFKFENNLNFKELTFDLSSSLANAFELEFHPQKIHINTLKSTYRRIGLNYKVPAKWANKSPSLDFWKDLYEILCHKGYNVSWQKGENNFDEYINWVYNQDLIITPNSLCLHLAMLFNIGIFLILGPTSCEEVQWLPNSIVYQPIHCGNFPCYKPVCPIGKDCFEHLDIREVASSVERRFNV
ncbi:MAG: hypothetical protein HQK79_04050 [Desulfobacterales bacterium]|nr:hypothetical protein [Desulfobacterales bacterium]